ncbi:MAG TPA: DUF58 domain-containing protein [Pirellulales bacterium]|nr:DUF58 domain-containing protein [Pirellulales bacterium]
MSALVLISFAIVAALLVLLARLSKVYPHQPLVLMLTVPGLLSLGLMTSGALFIALVAIDVAIVAAAVIDLLTLPRSSDFLAERQMLRVASLKKPQPVQLTVTNRSRRTHAIWVRDGVPAPLVAEPRELLVRLAPRSRSTLRYAIQAARRGAFTLSAIHLRVRSSFGLWQRYLDYPIENELNVYPDMKQLSEYGVLARTNRLSLVGVRRTRRIGQDNEFERLRDFTRDDNYKHIDWRSTARRSKLTVKDFQANQSQRLLFLVDCGRMMANEAAGLSLLDHSLNAMLMLSYVALKQGDSVGLVCFSDQIHGFVPPTGGMNQMNRLLHASFDRFPQMVESRYDEAFLYLASRCRKRALVVLITNLIDEVNANQVERYLTSLVGRHLPLGVLLRDRQLFEAADAPEPRDKALYRAAAAAEILIWRHQVLTDLSSKGVLSLDVFPEELTAPLVNSYLNIKARHLL